jgi:ankyrin repeat protein
MDGIRQLLDTGLQYSKPENLDERRFLEGIFITDPRDDRSALISRKGNRVEGTCAWVTETNIYRSWLSTAPGPSGLMLQGSPGKGKTMMAIYLTEQLELLSNAGNPVIYSFCDNRNPKQNTALSIVRSLLWQLCRLEPAVLCHGMEELEERGGKVDSILSFETLWRIFDKTRKDARVGSITCVIDGLDECDDDSVFAILNKLWRLEPDSRFKFLILSRPPTPRQQLPAATANVARLLLDSDEDEKVHQDVVEFVRQRVWEVANASPERRWSEKLRQYVEATLQKKAGGTFLWVGFVTQDLQRRTSTEVRKYLKSLPADLNEIYDRILKGLPTEHRAVIRSLLHWITLAEHPMRLSELVNLINIPEPSDRSADTDSDSDSISNVDSYQETEEDVLRDLLAFVGHFVLVVGRTVYFVHQSAKDYLLRSGRAVDPDVEYFRIPDREVGHEERARQCLDYLHRQLSLVKKEDGWGSDEYEYTSFHYALHFWRHHIEHSGKKLRYPDTIDKIVRLFRPDDLLWQWLQCLGKRSTVASGAGYPFLSLKDQIYPPNPPMGSDLGFAIDPSSGSRDVGRYPQMDTTYGRKPGMGGTDLSFAISLGLDVVFEQMLEDLAVDGYASAVSATLPTFNGPLRIALLSEKESHFQRLLDKYGPVAVSHDKDIIRHAVSHIDDIRLVRGVPVYGYLNALLAVTDDPRALYGSSLEMALAGAVERHNIDVTRLLVKKGADPSTTDDHGNSLLHLLADKNRNIWETKPDKPSQIELARFLLSQDCSLVTPDSTNESGATALHLAAFRQNSMLVQVLLDFGASPSIIDFEGRTPIHMAAMSPDGRSGEKETSKLLTQGLSPVQPQATDGLPTVHSQDRQCQPALHLAAFHGNKSMAQALLDHGASVHYRDGQGRTALHMAAAGANHVILRWLLDSGAHVNDVDLQGRTPLALVIDGINDTGSMENHKMCLAHLLIWDAACPGQDAEGRTLLHILARKLQHRAQEKESRNARRSADGPIPSATAPPAPWDWKLAQQIELERGAVHVHVPHLFPRLYISPLGQSRWDRHDSYMDLGTRDDHVVGSEIRKYLAALSVDEATKDVHGLTAREYYPNNDFWAYGEYYGYKVNEEGEEDDELEELLRHVGGGFD